MRKAARIFLDNSGWEGSEVAPVAGDLSARSYFRVTMPTRSAILMDAAQVSASIPPFLLMTDWLRKLGLSAPNVMSCDQENGLLLIEDLGQSPVSDMVSDAERQDSVLRLCIELLLVIRNAAPPDLTQPTAQELCDWTLLADEFYPKARPDVLGQFREKLLPILSELSAKPATVSLRDFHADNLMWLPNRTGVARLGLLDYQDAMLTHPVYDLVSLLTDARTEIVPQVRRKFIAAYARAAGDDPDQTNLAFAALSLQRNLRILGIFHRAAKQDGKAHHLPKVPRVYAYLQEALAHPAFSALTPLLFKALPPPKELT